MHLISDLNVMECKPLPAPAKLLAALPMTGALAALICRSRQIIHDILSVGDPRLLAVIGPCSIQDVAA